MSIFYDEVTSTEVQNVNVKNYGARGNGVVDDTAAIQAAIDDCAVGNTLHIPMGTYLISSTLNLNKGLILAGAGRGHEGATTVGSSFKWVGASGTILHINTGIGSTVHGWSLRDLTFDGNSVSGVTGIVLGAGNLGTPRAAVGTLDRLWLRNCLYAGLDCWTAQLCQFNFIHGYNCGKGILFSAGTNKANTDCLVSSCRMTLCGIGYELRRLSAGTFINCTAENNTEQGIYIATGATDESVLNCSFYKPWMEANLSAGGTGRGQIQTFTSSVSVGSAAQIYEAHFSQTPASNFDLVLSGGIFTVDLPNFTASGTALHCSGSVGYKTIVHGRWEDDPSTWVTYTAGTGVVRGVFQKHEVNGVPDNSWYIMSNGTPVLGAKVEAGKFTLTDKATDASIKTARLMATHYTTAEEGVAMVIGVNVSGGNSVLIGGGSSSANTATKVETYAASDSTTVTGTAMTRVNTTGLDILTGTLRFASTTELSRGTASPEGVVSAPVGSLFLNASGGAGSVLFIKESGAGANGWVGK